MKWLLRALIALLVFYSAYQYSALNLGRGLDAVLIPVVSVVFLVGIFLQEHSGFKQHPYAYLGGFAGVLAGLITGSLIVHIAAPFINDPYCFIIINALLGYLGYSIGSRKGGEYGAAGTAVTPSGASGRRILDTSVIIDGRILDLANTGFLDGELIIPRFVLAELQRVADSADNLKRARGRRGLDILKKMQELERIKIVVTEQDFPAINEVDAKLVALSKDQDAVLFTNDTNLNRVAQIEGVSVLSINQLAEALRPVFLPGEDLNVTISREGREKGQGVAFLEDGTMVVVENSDHLLNQKLCATVTSVLQTPSGRMIFACPKPHEN